MKKRKKLEKYILNISRRNRDLHHRVRKEIYIYIKALKRRSNYPEIILNIENSARHIKEYTNLIINDDSYRGKLEIGISSAK